MDIPSSPRCVDIFCLTSDRLCYSVYVEQGGRWTQVRRAGTIVRVGPIDIPSASQAGNHLWSSSLVSACQGYLRTPPEDKQLFYVQGSCTSLKSNFFMHICEAYEK